MRNPEAAHVIQFTARGRFRYRVASEGTLSPPQKAGLAKIAE